MNLARKFNILSIFAAVMLTPVIVYAGVYFIEGQNSPGNYEQTRPCFVDYPLFGSCSGNKTPQNFCPKDNRYYRTCACDTNVYKYNTSNCTDNKTLGGRNCDNKYETCACDAKYKYNSTNCTGGKVLGGNSCGGNYETCLCPSGYTKTCSSPMIGGETACDGKYKTCKCPSNFVTCNNGGAAGAAKCTEENGTVKWSECKALTCTDGGFVSSIPNNQTCTQVTYEGKTCYKDCRALTCEDGGYQSATNGATCSNVSYGGKTCYKDCKKDLTCQEWVKENSPGTYSQTIFTSTSIPSSTYSTTFYGPKYYSYSKCQEMATPTITYSSVPNYAYGLSLNYVNATYTGSDRVVNQSCKYAYEDCKMSYENGNSDFEECFRYRFASNNNSTGCTLYDDPENCCQEYLTSFVSSGSVTINNAVVTNSSISLFDPAKGGGITFKGTSKVTGTAVTYNQGQGAVVESGANVTVKSMSFYRTRLEVKAGGSITTDWLQTYNGGRTVVDNNSVHVYGTLYAKTTFFVNGPVHVYNGGFYKVDQIKACDTDRNCKDQGYAVGSGGYQGNIYYKTGAKIQIGSKCVKMNADGVLHINTSRNTNPLSGSGC